MGLEEAPRSPGEPDCRQFEGHLNNVISRLCQRSLVRDAFFLVTLKTFKLPAEGVVFMRMCSLVSEGRSQKKTTLPRTHHMEVYPRVGRGKQSSHLFPLSC